MKYVKQLDSFRAIAVLFVIIGHGAASNKYLPKIFNADFGVNLFFVLSGFLITWILLENKEKVRNSNTSLGAVFKMFYIRRTLRIFPLYYLCVLIFFLFSSLLTEGNKEIFPWLLSYSSNWYFIVNQTWVGHISHVWSLAVEEQFYLLWPTVMLLINRRYLAHAIIVFILAGTLFQFVFIGAPFINYFTITCFSAFGIGAFIAWLMVYKTDKLWEVYKLARIPALISVLVYVYSIFQSRWEVIPMARLFHSVIAAYIIMHIVISFDQRKLFLPGLWNNKFMVLTGKISYGLYLYHAFLPSLLDASFQAAFGVNLHYTLHPVLYFVATSVITFFVAWFSWTYFEKPILNQKKHFEYAKEVKGVF